MKNQREQEVIKKYLLGELANEDARQEIERRLLTDDAFEEEVGICEDELIDAYLEAKLSSEERYKFETVFLLSPDAREKLRFAQVFKTHLDRGQSKSPKKAETAPSSFLNMPRRAFLWQYLQAAAIVLLFFGACFGVWRLAFYQSEVEKGLIQLRAAYRGQRPIESRVTANFDYAPLIERRGSDFSTPDEKARRRAENLLLEAAEDNPTNAEANHALGLLYLAEGKPDEALKAFDRALKLSPRNAKLYSDIGAAFLEKAKRSEGKGDEFFINANSSLQNLNQALEINPSLLEALFNKALLLQKMRAINQAREAWENYLKKDSASVWADEARQNLSLLSEQTGETKNNAQIFQDFLDAYRNRNEVKAWQIASETKEFVTGIMIAPQLARKFLEAAAQNRRSEADEMISAFFYLGEIEFKNSADSYLLDLAKYYKNVQPSQYKALLEAHNEAQTAQSLLLKPDFKQALTVFNRSKELFSANGNVWEAALIEYQICYSLSQIDQIEASNARLAELSKFGERKKYKWLQSLADGWLGGNYLSVGEVSTAIVYNRKSLQSAREISDTYNIQRSLLQLAEEYRGIGNLRQSLDSVYNSLFFPAFYHSPPRQKWRNLFFTTRILYSFRLYESASVYVREEISLSRNELNDKWMSHAGFINSGVIYGALQKFAEAFEQTKFSLELAENFSDEEMKQRLTAASLSALANLQRQAGNCREALANYNRAIQIYEKMQFVIGNYEARRGRLLCYVSEKDDSAISQEMPELLKFFDENRRKITEEADRNIFFDNEQTVYDIATDYAHSKLKDNELAFNYAENSRARSLLSQIRGAPELSQPLTLAEIQNAAPADVQIVYYAVLADKLLIFYVSRTKFAVAEKTIAADVLKNKISEYTKKLNGGADLENFKSTAKELYGWLIEPIETQLEKNKTLCLVADKSLFRLSFAALVSPRANNYLIEDYQLLSAPSATLFINETEIAKRKETIQKETILSVGNPAFSRAEYPQLANLNDAVIEVQEIGALYKDPKVYLGKQARKEQIIRDLNETDVFHFAGHYVANEKSPSLSKLLLAADSSSFTDDDLSIEEIRRNKFARTRLIVLSACDTGIEQFYDGEGMIGAARAFLAADVPLIVASLWSVESTSSAELMIKFHRYRKNNSLPSIEALRRAQIDLLSDQKSRFRHPLYWAGFLLIGGAADF